MPFRIRISLIVLAAIVGAIVLLPLLWPIPPLEGVRPARDVAPADARWIDTGAIALHARFAAPDDARPVRSDTPGVAFLHGFGSNLESFRTLQEALAAHVATVAWDRPAFGFTERVVEWTGPNPYRPRAQVDQTLQALDAAGIERAVLVGHSAGGAIALQTALAHPDRVAGLVLIAPAVHGGGGAPSWSRWALHTPQLDRIGPLLMRQLGGQPGENLLRTAYADPSRLRDEVLEAYRLGTHVARWDEALWELVKASRRPDVADRLSEVTVPALVVAGTADEIVPTEQTRRLAEELPDARMLTLDDCGHVPQEECPDPLIDAIEDWWFDRIAP